MIARRTLVGGLVVGLASLPAAAARAAAAVRVGVISPGGPAYRALLEWHVKSADGLRTALGKLTRTEADGYVFTADGSVTSQADLIVKTATERGLPTITIYREAVLDGALASYGAPFGELGRIAAKPLRAVIGGARPGDIPVEAFNRVTLVVNVKAAKRMGLTIPESVLLRADEVIDQ